jgi:hypothetical protein
MIHLQKQSLESTRLTDVMREQIEGYLALGLVCRPSLEAVKTLFKACLGEIDALKAAWSATATACRDVAQERDTVRNKVISLESSKAILEGHLKLAKAEWSYWYNLSQQLTMRAVEPITATDKNKEDSKCEGCKEIEKELSKQKEAGKWERGRLRETLVQAKDRATKLARDIEEVLK